jgi:hypothetical protein
VKRHDREEFALEMKGLDIELIVALVAGRLQGLDGGGAVRDDRHDDRENERQGGVRYRALESFLVLGRIAEPRRVGIEK